MSQKVRKIFIYCAVVLAVVLFFVLRSVLSNDTVVPGNADMLYSTDYGRYLSEVPDDARPDEVIKIAASDYSSYTEDGLAVTPETRSSFEGYDGESVLTGETGEIIGARTHARSLTGEGNIDHRLREPYRCA